MAYLLADEREESVQDVVNHRLNNGQRLLSGCHTQQATVTLSNGQVILGFFFFVHVVVGHNQFLELRLELGSGHDSHTRTWQ